MLIYSERYEFEVFETIFENRGWTVKTLYLQQLHTNSLCWGFKDSQILGTILKGSSLYCTESKPIAKFGLVCFENENYWIHIFRVSRGGQNGDTRALMVCNVVPISPKLHPRKLDVEGRERDVYNLRLWNVMFWILVKYPRRPERKRATRTRRWTLP